MSEPHGGSLAIQALQRHGVDVMFTLSGGHLFVLYDGAVKEGLRLVDVRHEQTATFAAEGWAKVTRRLGCAALTAGPGVTNGVSAIVHEVTPENAVQKPVPIKAVDFVSEDDVRKAIQDGAKIYISKKTILTPSARDLGEEKEVFANV